MMAYERKRLYEKLCKSDLKDHGNVIPASYLPLLFTYHDIGYFANIIKDVCGLLKKITEFYIQDSDYRRIFKLDRKLEDLIMLPPSCDDISPVGRVDVFLSDGGFKICEVNTDGTGGMSRADFINGEMAANPMIRSLFPAAEVKSSVMKIAYEITKSYLRERKFPATAKKPMIAVVDFREEGVFSDFDRFVEAFKFFGFDSEFADIRDLVFDGKNLFDKKSGKMIDVIYRRAVSSVVADRIDECQNLLEAVKNRKITMIGDFRSTLMHSKSISAAVFHPKTFEKLTAVERNFIDYCFPRTYFFDAESVDEKTLAYARSHKGEWVLKPQEGFASKGVVCGKDVSEKKWLESLDSLFGSGYILQEFCNSYKFPALRLDGSEIENIPVMIGLYFAAGQFAGLYNRAGANGIIDYNHGGVYYPSVFTGTVE